MRFKSLITSHTRRGSYDLDEDGDVDLFTAHSGSIWFHDNKGDHFESRALALPLADNTTPLSIALGDINKDNKVGLYISGYIKIEEVTGQTGIALRLYSVHRAIFTANCHERSAFYHFALSLWTTRKLTNT